MTLNKHLLWIIFILSPWWFYYGSCQANQLTKTKKQLAQLSVKIRYTERSLGLAKEKRTALQNDLAVQEKKIGQLIIQKSHLSLKIKKNNQAIIHLSEQIKALQDEIAKEQLKLAQQIRSRYMIDNHQPLKWLLSPGSKEDLSHILAYYQYVIYAQQQSIHSINTKTEKLNNSKTELNTRISQDRTMHHNLAQQQSVLESAKHDQQKIIDKLGQVINSKSQKLKEFHDNQAVLSRIIKKLTQKKRIMQNKPFASRRHHLPRPVSVNAKAIKSIHQGLEFFAREGTAVKAIHPGKILFSDWLKGYGLLLIIDHGHGYMTLYAHNQALTKQKGDWVEGGEKIAEVGHSGGLRENGLYFEIRHNGKAISPINWLS